MADNQRNSALIDAINQNQNAIAEKIIAESSDVKWLEQLNGSQQNALSLAIEKDNDVIINALLNKSADVNLALYAHVASAKKSDLKTILKFYHRGADPKKALKIAKSKNNAKAEKILDAEVRRLEIIESYKAQIQRFLNNQIARLPQHDIPELVSLSDLLSKTHDPKKAEVLVKEMQKKIHCPKERQYLKRIELEALSKKLQKSKDFKSLESIVDEIKKITAVHQDVGMLGFLKFNYFRQTTNRKVINTNKIELVKKSKTA